jgi:sulfate transport system substrate-binding protein
MSFFGTTLIAAAALALTTPALAAPKDITNVSYDIARELYSGINKAFVASYKAKTGQTVEIKQSHGGSSAQARKVLEGFEADTATFNQVIDIEALVKGGLVQPGWQQKFPNNASPFYSLPAFLVRAGNPKNIKDWDDLVRADVKPVLPNPKTAGNARYTYLAAYAFALSKNNNDQAKAQDFVKRLLGNVPVFDTGARGSTTTFAEREIGDVLLTFEAEVNAVRREYGEGKFQIVLPSQSLLAEFPVAIVDKVADAHKSRDLAKAYLDFLFSPEGQEIGAQNYHRVRDAGVAAKYKTRFPDVKLVTVEDVFGGWDKVFKDHFADGGILDQVFVKK